MEESRQTLKDMRAGDLGSFTKEEIQEYMGYAEIVNPVVISQ